MRARVQVAGEPASDPPPGYCSQPNQALQPPEGSGKSGRCYTWAGVRGGVALNSSDPDPLAGASLQSYDISLSLGGSAANGCGDCSCFSGAAYTIYSLGACPCARCEAVQTGLLPPLVLSEDEMACVPMADDLAYLPVWIGYTWSGLGAQAAAAAALGEQGYTVKVSAPHGYLTSFATLPPPPQLPWRTAANGSRLVWAEGDGGEADAAQCPAAWAGAAVVSVTVPMVSSILLLQLSHSQVGLSLCARA